jgi:site-specific DNA-methyltransferase (adenine-specific)
MLGVRDEIEQSLQRSGIAILPPLDVTTSMRLLRILEIQPTMTMLDPWYNKGVGGVRDDYTEYIVGLLKGAADLSSHVYLWGFPEIVALFVERVPPPLKLVSWLTWYYKNNPSVIRGWRSSQMTCLHLSHPDSKLYPQHFLNEAQKQKQSEGKLRYMPGPTSVIEAPLNIGFVGKNEQTGHPAQKPVSVFERLIMMTTTKGDLVFDPMSGSGTTATAAQRNERQSIICDVSEEYTSIAEQRLNTRRLSLDSNVIDFLARQ